MKKTILYMHKGVISTPKWFFNNYTEDSLARFGLHKFLNKGTYNYIYQIEVNVGHNHYSLKVKDNQRIVYLGDFNWNVVDDENE